VIALDPIKSLRCIVQQRKLVIRTSAPESGPVADCVSAQSDPTISMTTHIAQ
jgi:hypothetical protein